MDYANVDLSQAKVRVLSEAEHAAWQRETGRRVEFAHGRFWINHQGFYRLTHFAATMPATGLRRPTKRCFAFHVLLTQTDAAYANARSPIHLIRDLSAFDESQLDESKRKELRRARKVLDLIQIRDPRLLHDQGWRVLADNIRRIGVPAGMTEAKYRAGLDARVADARRLIIGAMAGDQLVGYLETFAVDGVAYHDRIYLADASRSVGVSALLHVEALHLYGRSADVSQMCAGLPVLERMGISEFKRRIGIPIVDAPAYFWSPRVVRAVLRRTKPGALYRATGELPPDFIDAIDDSSPTRAHQAQGRSPDP